jgi:uncharacterized alkaline shock family protein YloU
MEGHASISPDVLARYAADAALEVDGVQALARHKPVRIAVADDGAVSVELHLALDWGAAFAQVGTAVQDRVGDYLAHMAGARPVQVDILVADVGR